MQDFYIPKNGNFPKIDVYKTGQNIKRIMRRKGMAVKDLQEFLGLSAAQSIYHWFDGRSLPTVDNLYALSALFHMPMDEIVCGSKKGQYDYVYPSGCQRLLAYYAALY